jgi:hypothetical protein
MGTLAMFFASFIKSGNWMNLVSFFFMVKPVLFNLIVSLVYSFMGGIDPNVYQSDTKIEAFVFSLFPWFHLMRIFNKVLDITKVEGWNDSETAAGSFTIIIYIYIYIIHNFVDV